MRFEIKPANELSSSSLPLFLPFLWRFRSGQILIVEREERRGTAHWFTGFASMSTPHCVSAVILGAALTPWRAAAAAAAARAFNTARYCIRICAMHGYLGREGRRGLFY